MKRPQPRAVKPQHPGLRGAEQHAAGRQWQHRPDPPRPPRDGQNPPETRAIVGKRALALGADPKLVAGRQRRQRRRRQLHPGAPRVQQFAAGRVTEQRVRPGHEQLAVPDHRIAKIGRARQRLPSGRRRFAQHLLRELHLPRRPRLPARGGFGPRSPVVDPTGIAAGGHQQQNQIAPHHDTSSRLTSGRQFTRSPRTLPTPRVV